MRESSSWEHSLDGIEVDHLCETCFPAVIVSPGRIVNPPACAALRYRNDASSLHPRWIFVVRGREIESDDLQTRVEPWPEQSAISFAICSPAIPSPWRSSA